MAYPLKILALLMTYALKMASGNICTKYAENINTYHPTETYKSPNILGEWTSSRCEITPGRKFIVRRFDITNYAFLAFIYHYQDSWCEKPDFLIKVTGTYESLPGTATPFSSSSFVTKFNFNKIYLRIMTEERLQPTMDKIIEKCSIGIPVKIQKLGNETIDDSELINNDMELPSYIVKKKSCRYFFGLHVNSYKKIRMVKTDKRKMGIKYDELFFGDIPLKSADNKQYTHLQFQYSLSRLDRPECDVCKIVKKSSSFPVLPKSYKFQGLKGEWVTEVCEAQDDTKFLSKYYHFTDVYPGKKYGSVTIHQSYFSDSDCTERIMNVKTGGIYFDIRSEENVDGVVRMKLKLTWLTLAAFEETTLKVMEDGEHCGKPELWEYGVEQNLTETNGCKELHLVVPSIFTIKTRVISKKKGNSELYINDDNPKKYFTNNLVECDSSLLNISQPTTQAPTENPIEPIDNFLPVDNTGINHDKIKIILPEKVNNRKGNSAVRLKFSFLILWTFVMAMIFAGG